jgi:hypothetical protein
MGAMVPPRMPRTPAASATSCHADWRRRKISCWGPLRPVEAPWINWINWINHFLIPHGWLSNVKHLLRLTNWDAPVDVFFLPVWSRQVHHRLQPFASSTVRKRHETRPSISHQRLLGHSCLHHSLRLISVLTLTFTSQGPAWSSTGQDLHVEVLNYMKYHVTICNYIQSIAPNSSWNVWISCWNHVQIRNDYWV